MAGDRVVIDASYILESIIPTASNGREAANSPMEDLASGWAKAVVPRIVILDPPSVVHDGAMPTGAQVYDSMYAVLAEAMGLPIASSGRGMRTAARSMKTALFAPV